MNVQIRIRTDAQLTEMGYVADWLSECPQGFAFEHSLPDNHHYHIYLFGVKHHPDWMRRHLGKHLPSKEHYAVSTTCGKKKKPVDTTGAYIYGTTSKLLSPVWFRGFSDDEMSQFAENAHKFWRGHPDAPIQVVPQEKKPPRVPYQQAVIADAMADWENYKRECRDTQKAVNTNKLAGFVCDAMRRHGRGINPHLVRDCAYAVLYDDEVYSERILRKINLDI